MLLVELKWLKITNFINWNEAEIKKDIYSMTNENLKYKQIL